VELEVGGRKGEEGEEGEEEVKKRRGVGRGPE